MITERPEEYPVNDVDQHLTLARQCRISTNLVVRVVELLPAMSIGYEPGLCRDLLHALACFADVAPDTRNEVADHLARLGWTDQDIDEVLHAIARLHTDPRTPEEWIVHDAYVITEGEGHCITPWGVHLQAHPDAVPPRSNREHSSDRLVMLDAILDHLESRRKDHPLRIAIDGGTAAGKTTLAENLAIRHGQRGGAAIRASFDFFKVPPEKRSQQGFGGRIFDADALIDELLEPLGPGGSRNYRVATYDGWTKRSLQERPARVAPDDTLAFVDGAFLWTERLREWWDFWIFVEVDTPVAIERFVVRDALWQDDTNPDHMRARFRARYLPAESAYAQAVDPRGNADVLVRNDDPAHPVYRFADPHSGTAFY
jgi:uridine kinase